MKKKTVEELIREYIVALTYSEKYKLYLELDREIRKDEYEDKMLRVKNG